MKLQLGPETAADEAAVTALIERIFGPGRLAKTAERLREGNRAIASLSFVARRGDRVVGAVRLWPLEIGGAPALLLGPLAVGAGHRNEGLGARLIGAACAAADTERGWPIMLVGDEPYYAPFGFAAALAREVILPGPVDPRRVLARPGVSAPTPSGPAAAAPELVEPPR
ncbi:MAG TPA: N-acetyltransferase [Caulobacteraceae bacterium]|nr:N-acetyltransferase [Caulobacteraceae bacterium]